jgi:sugar phosphate isomerase/epimerase
MKFPALSLVLSSLLAVLPSTVTSAGDFAGTAGIQLYSLREQFKKDVPGTLDHVKALGFTQVETATTYGLPQAEFLAMLKQRGLKPVAGHFQYEPLTKKLDECIAEAKALGYLYAVCPWIPHEIGNFNEADVQRAAADFNRIGEAFKKEGIAFAYHCHGYEFKPVSEGATETLFDRLAAATKPEFVAFEMDVFWVFQPGQNPAKLLERYGSRWHLMHLKDIRKGARIGVFTGKADKTDDVVLGTGQVDWPETLRAAAKAGVKYYFIEDESPSVLEQIPASLKYLETLK